MFKRIVIATLWFAAFLCLHEIAWSVLGSPRAFGVVIGTAAAAFYFFDPSGRLVARPVIPVNSAAR